MLENFTGYEKKNWKNSPDKTTPLSAENLDHMDSGIKMNADAVIELREQAKEQKKKTDAALSAVNTNKNILASATFISPNRIESDLELDNINVPGNSINISMAYTIKWEWGFAITMNIDGVYLIQAFFAGQTLAQRYCQLPSRNWHDWDIK